LLFLGDESDRKVALELGDLISWPHATLNLAGKLSLWESALALKEADVLLSNDSSLAHISEAVDTPAAVLFGPTIEAFGFSPRMRTSKAFSTTIGCRPCSKHGKTPCRYSDQACFTGLDSKSIAEFLIERVR
jgi:ADP-heptose:LPS heptosyltransferase